jgi:hypothetical protein
MCLAALVVAGGDRVHSSLGLSMAIYKNKASQKVAVFAWDIAADAPKTGDAANITAQISLNGGACAALTDTNPTELDATNAKGVYVFDLTQAESNADMVILSAVSSTADIELEPLIIYTEPETRAATTSLDSLIVHSGTAQAGASGSVTLASGASATDDFYNDAVVVITGGTGAGQARQITDYTGSTRVATVDTNWVTTPDNTSTYAVIGRIV